MRWRLSNQLTPSRFLAMVNVVVSGLAFVKSVIVARGLGPELLGVIAVISGVNVTLLNFFDVRLTDLAAKLYYQIEEMDTTGQRAHRGSVFVLCVAGNLLISVLLGVGGVLVTSLLIHFFTAAPVAGWWLVAQAIMLTAANLSNTFNFLQRFSRRFYFVGTLRLAIQVIGLGAFLWLFAPAGTVDNYYRAGVASGLIILALTIAQTLDLWVRHDHLPVLTPRFGRAWPDYRRHLRFLFYGNLLGYTKLLHRAADTLVVGLFADDRTTGLYKLARSLTDGLYVLFDAMNQVYQPRFLELLAAHDWRQYRELADRILATCAAFTAVALVAQAVLLRPFLTLVFSDRYLGIEPAVMLLTAPFVFVAGAYIWLWPTFIHSGRLGWFTMTNMAAALGQYSVTFLLFAVFGPGVTGAAAGYLAHYLILYPVAYGLARSRFTPYLPGWMRA